MMVAQRRRVLIVEDDWLLRKALYNSLSAGEFTVEEACHREGALYIAQHEGALEAIQDHRFDLVVLDIDMPGLSGIEMCRQIRILGPRVGIIVLAASDAEEDTIRTLEAGADDYLTKPFRLA
jgi:DNA-binding response OmpR family regulator